MALFLSSCNIRISSRIKENIVSLTGYAGKDNIGNLIPAQLLNNSRGSMQLKGVHEFSLCTNLRVFTMKCFDSKVQLTWFIEIINKQVDDQV